MEQTPSTADGSSRAADGRPPIDDLLRRRLAKSIDERHERLVKVRRRLHATPEASGEERETTAFVVEMLRDRGLEPRVMSGDTGVIADFDLAAETDTFIALRSELDCVDVNDDKQVPYASTRPGRCHACGHDVHTTINLAVASVLAEYRDELVKHRFRHNLRLIFQPAEESATGARSMIKQGALNGVEAITALHVDPFLEVGRFGLRNGALTSACKSFQVVLRGRGGHSARPHESVDPIPAATSVVSLFYQLCPRNIDSRYPMALTVSSIHAGAATNAIPDEAVISGTLRAARLLDLEAVQRRMESVARGVAEATGCDVDLEFLHSCPNTDNDPRVVEFFERAVKDVAGPDAVEWLEVPSLGGEDFAFYQELIPGAMMRLGAAAIDPRGRRPLHSSLFDVNEDTLGVGAKVMIWSALQLASSYSGHQT